MNTDVIPAKEAVSEVTKCSALVAAGFSLRKLRTLKGAATTSETAAKAGIHDPLNYRIPAFAGMTSVLICG